MKFVDLAAQRARLGSKIDDAIATVLDHGVFIGGPEVTTLEEQLSAFTGARHCVTCANGTDALVLSLRAIGLKPGDGVVVPSFTFAATPEAVVLAGGVPVFADIDPGTFNIDPTSAALAQKEAERVGIDVVGAIAVDLFGHPAAYSDLSAALPGVWLVADGAQSLGASVNGARVGTLASITTTSFFPSKPLGCYGDGGAIFTDDDDIADVVRSLRVHGQGSDKYNNIRVGTNSRLDTIQAAVLLTKLQSFPDELNERQGVADQYRIRLADSGVVIPRVAEGSRSAWAQYTVRVPDRDVVAAALSEASIPTAVYYRQPLHLSTAYALYAGELNMSHTETASREVLSLPMHPYLTAEEIDRVTALVRR